MILKKPQLKCRGFFVMANEENWIQEALNRSKKNQESLAFLPGSRTVYTVSKTSRTQSSRERGRFH